MIELRINNVTLPLPAGLKLTREIETTIFNRELTVTDFTYPVDIPLTDEAIVALGFPTSIANPGLRQDYVCDFIIDGIYVDQVILRVLKVSLRNKTASVSLIGKYGAFARLYNGLQVNQLTLGGVRTVGTVNGSFLALSGALPITNYFVQYKGNNVATHIQQVNTGAVVTDYVFGQVLDTSNTLAMQGDGVNVINGWSWNNFTGPGFTAGVRDPVHNYLLDHLHDINSSATNNIGDRWWWVPQFRLHYVLRHCLEEVGFTVSGAVFSDARFQQIVLHNTFCINRCSFSYTVSSGKGTLSVTHDATRIDPRNHVPAMGIVEFLQEVGKAFNLHYDIDLRTMTVGVRQVSSATAYGSVVDLSGIAAPDPELNFEQQDYSRGFDFSFADVGDAQVNEDVSKYPLTGWQRKVADLALIPSPALNDMAYVMNENAYYQWDGFQWGFYSDNLGHCKTSAADNLMEVTSKCAPLKLRTDSVPLFEAAGSGFVHYSTAAREVNAVGAIGMCGNGIFTFDFERLGDAALGAADRLASCFYLVNEAPVAHNPVMLNWLGLRPVAGTASTYAMLSCAPYDANGTTVPGYFLGWQAPAGSGYTLGLYREWWAQLAADLTNCIEAEYRLQLDALTLNNLDWNSNVFLIDGLYWLCKKASIVLPLPDVTTVQMVRI